MCIEPSPPALSPPLPQLRTLAFINLEQISELKRMMETTSFTNYSHHNFTAGKTESQKGEWLAAGVQHSPSGKRRRKDKAEETGAGAVLLSPGLHSLLSSSAWGPICISASLCIQPVNGLFDQGAGGRVTAGTSGIKDPKSLLPAGRANESFRGK